jgi:dienelactone hydrolase
MTSARSVSPGRYPANIGRRCLKALTASLILVTELNIGALAQPAPGPVGSPEGVWRDQIHWIPMVDAAGSQRLLQARICRPPGDMPARIVVMAHGTFPNNLNTKLGHCTAEATRWFLDRGFIVVMALRRGYGATGGDWAEGISHKPGDDYVRPGLETARDIAATVDYATALPYARPQAAVVIGHSGGGWGTIAYNSIPHSRATALVSMAGGRGQSVTKDGVWLPELGVWRPDLLVDAAGQFGRRQRHRCFGSIAKTTDTSRRRWLHRFTMHSRETEVRQSLTRSLHTATTDIVSSSERVARKSGDRWSKAILPGNQRNSARDELWRTKRAWIETGGVLRRTTAYGAQGPYDKRQEAR